MDSNTNAKSDQAMPLNSGMQTNLIVDGFRFESLQEAQEAEKEKQKIKYLESRIDYSDLRKVQAIYEKAVKDNIFRTQLGFFYLKGIRDFLVREDAAYDAKLSVLSVASSDSAKTKTAQAKREEKHEKAMLEKKGQLRVSIIINVLLFLAIIAMFFITLNSQQPNILNYEKAITDKYAYWEQQLTEREKAVREKELQLFREE